VILRTALIRRSAALCLLALAPAFTGCKQDDDISAAITQFQTSSATFTAAYTTMLNNTNTVETENYINTQALQGQAIDAIELQKRGTTITAQEIAIRTAAIQALADYTAALATLASGKSEAQVQTDFNTASTSVQTLNTDLTKLLPGATLTKYQGPVSAAVGAISNVVTLVLHHHHMTEVRRSILDHDQSLDDLFKLISTESGVLYDRQKSAIQNAGNGIIEGYETVRMAPALNQSVPCPLQIAPAPDQKVPPCPNQADLLQMADRYKQWQKDSVAVAGANPADSIAAFQKCHDKLVDVIVNTKSLKPKSLQDLITAVQAFAADVTPLANNLKTLASSF
jgi:hypothetical protein